MKKLLSGAVIGCCFIFLSSFKDIPESAAALRYVNYSIFGTKYARTPILDERLKEHVYYIVSGHGGPDPGAMSKVGDKWISEDEYAYDVSLRLARNLIMHGAKVYMITRDENDGIRDEEILEMDKDETVWGGLSMPLNQRDRLAQRTDVINKLYRENAAKGYTVQRAIETHIDSRYEGKKVDVFFYHKDGCEEGRSVADAIYTTIKSKYEEHQNGRGYEGLVRSRNLWMLRESIPPMVYIELGNITNSFDQKRLLMPNNRQALANWIVLGVLKSV
jgi:N-acetylmuramoyl-L-alanine amidase